MPKNSLSFTIDGIDKEFEIHELTLRQIIDLGKQSEEIVNLVTLRNFVQEKFLPVTSNITFDDLLDLPPSDLNEVRKKFAEVNDSFFELAEAAQLTEFMSQIKTAILKDFSRLLVISLKPGTPKS